MWHVHDFEQEHWSSYDLQLAVLIIYDYSVDFSWFMDDDDWLVAKWRDRRMIIAKNVMGINYQTGAVLY